MLPDDAILERRLATIDRDAVRAEYLGFDEFVQLDSFLPAELLDRWRTELDALIPHVHRNYLPRHKKGGSVHADLIRRHAPTIDGIYRSPAFRGFLESIVGEPLQECPPADLHACALYCYTEAGDHIGYHYDTSYYKGRRYTVLIGIVDESTSALECRLFTRDPNRDVETTEVKSDPGKLILFNGDKLHHRVTPLEAGGKRYVVTMQYVTSTAMNPFLRFVSDMKDALAYFGFRRVFGRRARA